MTSRIERAEWLKGLAKDKEISDKLRIAGYHQSGNAGYGNPKKIDWGPPRGQRPPGPGARPPIKKA